MTIKLDENPSDPTSLSCKMVHELNNSVFVLQGNLEMILEDLPQDHPCRQFAAEALTAALRAKTLLAGTPAGEETVLQRESQQPDDELGPGPRGDSIRVLLVDDDAMLLDALHRGLKNLGFQVRECGDPQQALDLVRADPQGFDAVVSDLMMPQMTGQELAEQILNYSQNLPIILMSGFQGEPGGDIGSPPGVSQVLLKPLRFKDLAAAIVNCVGSTNGE